MPVTSKHPLRRSLATSRSRTARSFFGILTLAVLPLSLPLAALAAEQTADSIQGMDHSAHHSPPGNDLGPLIEKVRRATARYRDISVAMSDGWVRGTPCVSGPDAGAMGVHFVMPNRFADGVLNANEPEALIYEPLPGGAMRLVGVEFIQYAADWTSRYPKGPTPSLEGNLYNLVGEPNRYGLPAFYELHVWAWENNPKGSFADWNTAVTCDQEAGDPTAPR